MNERVYRLNRLLDLTRNLSAAQDLKSFLQSVVLTACELTFSEAASILKCEAEGDQLVFIASLSSQQEALKQARVPIQGSAAGWVFRNLRPRVIHEAARDKGHFKEVDRLTGTKTHCLLAVPLAYRSAPIGVLETINKIGDAHYTEEDVAILETLAALAASAIHEQELQEAVNASGRQVAALDRLKSDFIAITSHELRTPLGLILGHATFLRELVGKEYHEQLDAIIRNAARLKEIVENLASVDNYQSGAARVRQRTVSMARLVQESAESFQPEALRKGVQIHIEVGAASLPVEGEAGKIEIALNNLIKNAVTFTDRGGHVFVKAEAIPGYVKVSVIDDGVGIPAKELPRIFERFFQVESHLTRKHGGMGLGLSVAKAMIEMHGGRIWAESVEGHGSNFTFLLPMDPSQASAAEKVFLT